MARDAMKDPEQPSSRHLVHVLVLIAIFVPIALVYAAINIYNHIDDAYAQWGAADMVIDYMMDHHGVWPKNWTSVQTYFDKNNGRVGGWSFANFRSHVYIDFDADPNQLSRLSRVSDSVPFDVIHATSIWGSQFDDGPNETLYHYFRNGRRDAAAKL